MWFQLPIFIRSASLLSFVLSLDRISWNCRDIYLRYALIIPFTYTYNLIDIDSGNITNVLLVSEFFSEHFRTTNSSPTVPYHLLSLMSYYAIFNELIMFSCVYTNIPEMVNVFPTYVLNIHSPLLITERPQKMSLTNCKTVLSFLFKDFTRWSV